MPALTRPPLSRNPRLLARLLRRCPCRHDLAPDQAARKLVEIANATEPDRDGRIAIELINQPFLSAGGSPDEYRAGIARAIASGWLIRHESGVYVKFTQAGADLFA